ncbi:MAG: pilin [Nanoarchaeota archaeon]|nr:pilin [Nanoarchaeota archaeon]
MMKKYLFLVLIILFFVSPFLVQASILNEPLVQCGTTANKTPCTLCDVFKLVQRIINFISVGLFILAPIFIVVGGLMILLAGAKPSNLETGKSIIKNAIIGVIIALLAWVVINEILIVLAGSTMVEGKEVGSILKMPWNKIDCTGGGVNEDGDGTVITEGDYCVCEAPVYDLNPNQYPSQATIIGTNIKATKLTDKNKCKTDCIKASAEYYCPSALKVDAAKLYCTTESDVKSKKVHAVQIQRSTMCQISTNQCWAENEKDKCTASITPEAGSLFNPTYARKCFVNGEALCDAKKWSNTAFYCPSGISSLCPTDKPYVLYRYAQEVDDGTGEMDALKCSTYGSSSWSCRLNFQPNECSGAGNQWCQRSDPSGSDKWILSSYIQNPKQKGDASSALTTFLNCIYIKEPQLQINAISSNVICSDPSCNPSEKNCGHSIDSCHFGGTSSNCKGLSYAVDFNTNIACSKIKIATKQCDSGAWFHWEVSHSHVSVGRKNGCGCDPATQDDNCPSGQ